MIIEFRRDWRRRVTGERTSDYPDGMANVLISRGIAVEIARQQKRPAKVETAAMDTQKRETKQPRRKRVASRSE